MLCLWSMLYFKVCALPSSLLLHNLPYTKINSRMINKIKENLDIFFSKCTKSFNRHHIDSEIWPLYTSGCSVASDSATPWTCNLPGSSVHGNIPARIVKWVATSHCKGSSWPRDQTQVSCVSCIGRQILYHCTPVSQLRLRGGMRCEEFYGQGVELLIRIKMCPGPASLLPSEDFLELGGLLICCSWGSWIVTFSWISSIWWRF